MHEEYEGRIVELNNQHEEDLELLQEELRESDRRYQAFQSQAEHEHALLMHKCETLDAYLRDKEDRLAKEQQHTSAQMDA